MHAGSLESTREAFVVRAKSMNQLFITLLNEICDEKPGPKTQVKKGKNR